MAEYIEREAALDAISEWLMKALHTENMSSYNEGERAAYRTTLSEVAEIPAADVRPAVRGRWDDKTVAFFFKCSECGCCVGHRHDVFLDRGKLNYCPNCGADMRELS